MASYDRPELYQALVDMGSNGIRFSISDLNPPTARVMPTIYQDRCGISLYDVQYQSGEKGPIPQETIDEVLTALMGFRRTCLHFGVHDHQVSIVATEATRTAVNSEDFRQQIEIKTGWKVEMLAKEDEGRVGAMGVASSFDSIRGLVLDLGGGSIQLTWMLSQNGEVETSSKGSVSFPYGAAAITKQLERVGVDGQDSLRQEMSAKFESGLQDLEIPQTLMQQAEKEGGLTLYLSGGGFRGWGYILMSLHKVQPYPISIINGFRVHRSSFLPEIEEYVDPASTFRISSHRASQLPAIVFILKTLTQSIPSISYVHFAQGGVREGRLFSSLPASIRSHHPLVAATMSNAPPSTPILVQKLRSTIPPLDAPNNRLAPSPAALISPEFLTSVIHLLNTHASFPKDIRAAAALRSTTTGFLGSAHGLSHMDRALLALVLCERWGGEMNHSDVEFQGGLQELVGQQASWWARFIGRAAVGIGECHPAGLVVKGEEESVQIESSWVALGGGTNRKFGVRLEMIVDSDDLEEAVESWGHDLEKVGKKKNWVDGRDGFGVKVMVSIVKR